MKNNIRLLIKSIALIVFFSAAFNAYAQPVETVNKFLQSKTYEESKLYICCNMDIIHTRKEFESTKLDNTKYDTPYEFYNNDSSALVIVPIKMPPEAGVLIDSYLYLLNISGEWKIEDQRLRMVYDQFTFMSMRNYSNPYSQGADTNIFVERFRLHNSPDEMLIDYFNINKDKFDALLLDAENLSIKDTSFNVELGYTQISPPVNNLFIAGIYKDNYPSYEDIPAPGVTFFEIENLFGGTGYLYAEEKSLLPRSKTIVVGKEIGGGWYLYKSLVDLTKVE